MNGFLILALVMVLLVPAVVLAQNANDKLTQGISAYEELEWETAITHLNDALELDLPKTSQIQAYEYLGLCYIDTNQDNMAQQVFKKLLEINFDHELNPDFPPKYLNSFKEAKDAVEAARPKTGAIFVKSDPSGAEVRLDNVPKGKTPTTILDVMAGRYSLKLTLKGYQEWEQSVTVKAGEKTQVNRNLTAIEAPTFKPRPPVETQTVKQGGGSSLPWILLGGAAVVGGGVAAVLLSSDSGGDTNNNNGNTNGGNGGDQTTSLVISLQFP